MLAALAASGFATGTSQSEPSKAPTNPQGLSSTSTGDNRRRSLRLSAKKSNQTLDGAASGPEGPSRTDGNGDGEAPEAAPAVESAPSDTVVNEDEFAADFTDDEVDVDAEVSVSLSCIQHGSFTAQVIDEEEDDEHGLPEKTVTVSVGDGECCAL